MRVIQFSSVKWRSFSALILEVAPNGHAYILYSSRNSHWNRLAILTDYHPCNGRTCPFYGECQAPTETTHKCVCIPCTGDQSAPLCDSNDVTHKNKCEYNYHVCQAQEEPGIKHYGGCKRKSLLVLCGLISYRKISRNQESQRRLEKHCWNISSSFQFNCCHSVRKLGKK